jgi:NitT/TauT family transport system substrate-binding protein
VTDSSRRAVLVGGLALAAIQPLRAQSLQKFTFILDFLPYGEYSPYFTALAKGWYKGEGLDVTIQRGAGSADTIKRIAAGQGDAGSTDFSTLISARANDDVPARGIASYFRRPTNAIFVRADSGINSLKDLAGKRVGTTPGNSNQILFPIVAAQAGISADSIRWVTMDGAALGPALIAGQIDGAPFGAQHEARLQKQAQEMAKTSLKVFLYADYGLQIYSLSMFATDAAVEKNAPALKAFLRGTIRGMKYAFSGDHFDECAKYVVDASPMIDIDAALGAGRVAAKESMTEEITSGKVAIGQFEAARVTVTRDTAVKYLGLKRVVPIADLYTNDLLPEVKPA